MKTSKSKERWYSTILKKIDGTVGRRVLAMTLALVMGFTLLPTSGLVTRASSTKEDVLGVQQTVDDPHTLTRPGDTFEDGTGVGSTLNAGKILVGKSVMDGDAAGKNEATRLELKDELFNMPSGSTTSWAAGEDNFLVTISQSSQMYGITSRIPVPMDVVFVIDTSSSMDEATTQGSDRATDVVTAANAAIESILEMNEHNRIAVVGFSDGASTLSALRHYDDEANQGWTNMKAASDHITWSGSNIRGRNADNEPANSRGAYNGGTNIHAGVVHGAKLLTGVTDTTVQVDTNGDGVNDTTMNRMPILIVLSDGGATYSNNDPEWWDAQGYRQGPGSTFYAGNGFLAALSAAYYKQAITTKYYGANSAQSAAIYTIGVGVTDQYGDDEEDRRGKALARVTLDPSANLDLAAAVNSYADTFRDYWDSYVTEGQKADGTFEIQISNNDEYTFNNYTNWRDDAVDNIDSSVTSLKYNDKYYPATSTGDITAAFEELVIEIQKRAITAPTLTNTTWGQDYSGFVTFTDPIGEYMEVKDVIGVTGEGYLYQGISLSKLAEGYDPDWVSDDSISDAQAAFNAALEQAFMDRMHLSTAAGAATPSLEQVRAILNVITYTDEDYRSAGNKNPQYDAGGGNVREFDYATYGGQLYYNSDADHGNSFVWFGKVHYPDGETENASGNEDYDVQFIGIAPKNADSIAWLHNGGTDAETLRESAKAAGANCIVRSHFMYGAAGGNREGEPADMLHFQVRVLTSLEEPHQQYVSIKAPASLLASQKVLIDDTDPNNLEAHYDELIPSRVIYEVGLRSDINANNVWTIVDEGYLSETLSNGTLANVNSDGTINFYTNDWDRAATELSHERALAHANFEVSNNNSFYRYEVNTPLYADENGNTPLTTKPVVNGTYWYERTYYTWTIEDDGVSRATQHTEMIKVTAPSVQSVLDAQCVQDTRGTWGERGQWCILAGVYSDETLTAGDDILKVNEQGQLDNTTGSASVVTHPTRDAAISDPKYTTWLGNNGKIVFYGEKPKSVTGDDITTSSTVETDAEIDGNAVKVGDTLTYTIQAVNTEEAAATITITDKIPARTALVLGSVTASAGGTHVFDDATGIITWTFTNVAANGKVEASFKVTVQEDAFSETVTNQGSIKIGENTYSTNITSNPVIGKQATAQGGGDLEAAELGQAIEYHIAWYNDTGAVANITITDNVPTGTTYVDGSATHSPALTTTGAGVVTALTWTFTNVAPGTEGVVTFRVKPDTTVVPDADGTLDVENHATIEFENGPTITTNEVVVPVETGELTLEKKVVDTTTDKKFEITLTESTGKLAGSFSTNVSGTVVTFASGVAKVSLGHEDSITIQGLPVGVIITVTEADPGAGYTAAYSDPTVSVIAGTPGASVTVTNTYKAAPTDDISTMFTLTKQLTSIVDVTRDFGFIAQAYDWAAQAVKTGVGAETLTVIKTVTSGDANKVTFTFVDKTFSEADTYYYLVSEQPGTEPEITYDTTQYLVKIVVADNGNGKLVATISTISRASASEAWPATWTNDTELDFVNHFKPEDISVVLEGTKTLTGRDLIEGEFTFVATETNVPAGETPVVRYGRNDDEGKILFDPIYYSETGTYTFNVTELATTGQDNMTFDTTTKEVTVEVKAHPNGDLYATVTYPDGKSGVEFSNTFTTQDVYMNPTLTAKKTLDGRPQLAGEFGFGVFDADGNEVSSGRVTAPSTASKTGADIIFSDITYSLDNFTNAAVVDGEGNKTETFTYTIRELVPTVGADPKITYDKSVFRFTVTLSYKASTGVLTATNNANYERINDAAGESVTAVSEAVAFTNTYTPSPAYVHPETFIKNVTGSNIPDDLTFGFRVIKAAMATNAAGVVESTPVVGGGVDYAIDDNDLYAVGDVVGTGISGALGAETDGKRTASISFSRLTFYQPGIYKAWIVENNAGATSHGVTHDASKYLMEITVTHNESTGKLDAVVKYYSFTSGDKELPASYTTELAEGITVAFNNTYAATGWMTIKAKKVLENRSGQLPFNFTLTEKTNPNNVHSGQMDGNGVITFDTLTFDERTGGFDSNNEKKLTYVMKEVPGSVPGINYDKSEYELDILLTHDNQGSITGVITEIRQMKDRTGADLNPVQNVNLATGVVFTNIGQIYQGDSVTIPLDKTLTGRDMKAGEFGFSLVHWATNGTPLSTPVVVDSVLVGNALGGVANDMSITRHYGITVPDNTTITYRISENPGALKGVIYDESVYEFDVLIKDADADGNKDGVLEATILWDTLKLVYDRDGNTITQGATAISFVNTYKSNSINHVLKATKTLNGRAMEAGEFVFEVYQTSFTPVGGTADTTRSLVTTGRNNAGAKGAEVEFSFDPITYSAPGVYRYEIKEILENNRKGITPDDTVYVVEVVVEDNTTLGSLEVTRTTYYQANGTTVLTGLPAFVNTYTPDRIPVVLDIDKVLSGRDMDANEFAFTVTQTEFSDGTNPANTVRTQVATGSNVAREDGVPAPIRFTEILVDKAGTYTYEVAENPGSRPGVEYAVEATDVITVTVEVEQDPTTGALSIKSIESKNSSGTDLADPGFTNVYTPTPIGHSFYADKKLTGMPLAANQFSFTAQLEKEVAPDDWEAQGVVLTEKNSANGLVTFASANDAIKTAGNYRWVVTEVAGSSPSGGTMTFDNSVFYVYVTVNDNPTTGKLSLGTVTYKKGTEDVTGITFVNTFVPNDVYAELPISNKTLIGRTPEDGEFIFIVKNDLGRQVAEGTNDETGKITFVYDADGDGVPEPRLKFSAVGTYFYTITEKDQPGAGYTGANVTYDPAQWTVRVDIVQDSATGALSVKENYPMVVSVTGSTATDTTKIVFTNTYDPTDVTVTLKGYKTLTGRDLTDGEFEFHLLNSAGNVVAKGYNDAAGVITFETLTYSTVTTAEYTIVEVDKDQLGVTYDTDVIEVQIIVTDNAVDGKLEASVAFDFDGDGTYETAYDAGKTEDDAQIKYENTYKGLPGLANVEVKKELVGRPLVSGEFEFILTEATGNPSAVVIDGGVNDEEGSVKFVITELSEIGRYTFVVTEKAGTDTKIEYSQESFEIYVDVTDPGTGHLHAEVSYENGETPVFTNTYKPDPIDVTIEGTKYLMGRDQEDGEFSFEVHDSAGNLVATGKNKENKDIEFTPITLPSVGTYTLTVTEIHNNVPFVSYDAEAKTVVIVVTNENGVLKEEIQYPAGGLKFVNVYDVPYTPPAPQEPAPDTGDHSTMILWGVLAGLSALALGGVMFIRKRRDDEAKMQ